MDGAEPGPPDAVLNLAPEEADALLDRLERDVPVSSGVEEIALGAFEEAVVFGDTHGDWRSTAAAVERFLRPDRRRCLIGLGDYVDRAPDDCERGSVVNALYLLGLAADHPGRVLLLQGNHETSRRIPVVPNDFPEEVDDLWGPVEERYHRLVGLLERGPLGAVTASGAYLAHAGFPRSPGAGDWRALFHEPDVDRLAEIVWARADVARSRFGAPEVFGAADLERFLGRVGARIFLRGHDPDLIGKPVYGRRCLTLHTSRLYERYGGVLLARLPLDRPVQSTDDLEVERLPSRRGPAPAGAG